MEDVSNIWTLIISLFVALFGTSGAVTLWGRRMTKKVDRAEERERTADERAKKAAQAWLVEQTDMFRQQMADQIDQLQDLLDRTTKERDEWRDRHDQVQQRFIDFQNAKLSSDDDRLEEMRKLRDEVSALRAQVKHAEGVIQNQTKKITELNRMVDELRKGGTSGQSQ